MYISAYVFLLQVQVEAVVTVSAKYDVTYITWVHKRKKSDDGKNIQKVIYAALAMLHLSYQKISRFLAWTACSS